MTDDVHYGLPEVRDPDTGELRPVDHTYTWNGSQVTIKLIPPSASTLEEWEELGDHMPVSKMREVIDSHLVKPEPRSDWTAVELLAYVHGISDYIGSSTELDDAIQEELEKRAGSDAGNSPPSSVTHRG